jgi:hypothetical protein
MPIPAGGSATINGVLYQLLWSLLRAARLSVTTCDRDEENDRLRSAILVLEPLGGGGDLQEIGTASRIVEQVKARSGGSTWSLSEVVEEVLPDLYCAVGPDELASTYRFVTEGRIGRWEEVYSFFKGLSNQECPATDVLSVLDDKNELSFAGGTTNLPGGRRTQRRVFEWIVESLRKRPSVQVREPEETTRRNLWHLLARFEIVPGQTADTLQQEVDSLLLALVDDRDRLAETRNALLTDLAWRARLGGAEIEPKAFLRDHGLNATPLTNWLALRRAARRNLDSRLAGYRYNPRLDVREQHISEIASSWTPDRPVLVLSGESGQGKTWLLCGLARILAADEGLVLLIRSKGDAERDLDRAADLLWQDIAGHDGHLPLSRIAARRRELIPRQAGLWLTLLIDDVRDAATALELAQHDWDGWGARLVMVCSPRVAVTVKHAAADRCRVAEVSDFSVSELYDYLDRRLGAGWDTIPSNVRATLRRPLLAHFYGELARGGVWQPANEFELFEAYWGRLSDGAQADYPHDAGRLRTLALDVLDGGNYPWTTEQLDKAGLDNAAIGRLRRVGWLWPQSRERFAIWHDRLLSWAIAKGLATASDKVDEPGSGLRVRLEGLVRSGFSRAGRALDDLPVDLLWLLGDPTAGRTELVPRVLGWLEQMAWNLRQELYFRRLPALGARIIPGLFERLGPAVDQENSELAHQIIGALTGFDDADISDRARILLSSSSPRLRRAAIQILRRRPSATALDRLWELHREMEVEPVPYLRENEDKLDLYEESFRALRACVRLEPAWLERAIAQADGETDPVHDLAYLLANLNGQAALWRRCKSLLKRKVSPLHPRCLAVNIDRHADAEEVDWLRTQVENEEDFVGPAALRALARLDPDAALVELDRLPLRELYLSREWCFAELLARRPDATRASIREMMKRHPEPIKIAQAFQGSEDSLDPPLMELLLDDLNRILSRELAELSEPGHCPFYLHLQLLTQVRRSDLIEVICRRAGSPLDHLLTAWLVRERPRPNIWARPVTAIALELLNRMSGEGLAEVVNCYLDADNPFGRMDGLKLAAKRPNSGTVDRLVHLMRSDQLWHGLPTEQGYATRALALLGRWREVIESVVLWGLRTLHVLTEYPLIETPLDDKAMAPAFEAIARGDQPPPGAILALGVGRRSDQLGRLRAVLADAPLDSDLALAGIIALKLLRDGSDETMAVLTDQLRGPRNRTAAKNALLAAGSDTALDAVVAHARSNFRPLTALALLQHPRTSSAMTELIRDHLSRLDDGQRIRLLEDILPFATDGDSLGPFLEGRAFHDVIREIAFSEYGGRRVIIQALSVFDPGLAFIAARKAFRNQESLNREEFPYLMARSDPEATVLALLSCAQSERQTSVLWAMGRAVGLVGRTGPVEVWLRSSDPDQRRAACLMSGWLPQTPGLLEALQSCLGDVDMRVVRAAAGALQRSRAARDADALVQELGDAVDITSKWDLIDRMLSFCDVGDEFGPPPDWAVAACKHIPYLLNVYLNESLKDRRKDQNNEARRLDWRYRNDEE